MSVQHAAGKPRVLIVDDNRDAADTLAMLLEIEDYEVEIAYDGAQGVACAQRFRPAIVLMDLDMPVMDGVAAAAALKADRRRMMLVAISAKCRTGLDHELRHAGFEVQLAKPVEPHQLLQVLNSLQAPASRRRH